MGISKSFTVFVFVLVSVLAATICTISISGPLIWSLPLGILSGLAFSAVLISGEKLAKRCNLRSFNTAIFGLFFGYLMGQAIWLVIDTIVNQPTLSISLEAQRITHAAILLFTTFLGLRVTEAWSEELHLAIPFVRLKADANKVREIVADGSVLSDPRMIDLAASGLLDHRLIIPRILLKELHLHTESDEDPIRNKARRTLDVIKRLEALPRLGLRYTDTDFPEIKEDTDKMVHLARFLNADLLTADISRVRQSGIDAVNIINIHAMANALKPIMQMGEMIDIKVQRLGKEPMQGVGYLEDGTMVVVNGGGDFIGETIKAHVLSVKHTSSGRMIFCNAESAHVSKPARPQGVPTERRREYATGSQADGNHRDYFLV